MSGERDRGKEGKWRRRADRGGGLRGERGRGRRGAGRGGSWSWKWNEGEVKVEKERKKIKRVMRKLIKLN